MPVSGKSSRESRRRAVEQARQAEARGRRRVRLGVAAGAVVVLAGVGVGVAVSGGNGAGSDAAGGSGVIGNAADYLPLSTLGALTAAPAPGALGPENVPIPSAPMLAGTSAATTGQTIDGISCQTSEQTVFHIHAHLTIFVNGQPRQVPGGDRHPGRGRRSRRRPVRSSALAPASTGCTRTRPTGSSTSSRRSKRTYTLGEFFDEWGQPLGPDQAGPAKGKVTVIVNGKVFKGNPRDVPSACARTCSLTSAPPGSRRRRSTGPRRACDSRRVWG